MPTKITIDRINDCVDCFKIKCLEKQYRNSNLRMRFECEHGHIFKKTWGELGKKKIFKCPICSGETIQATYGVNSSTIEEVNKQLLSIDIKCNSAKFDPKRKMEFECINGHLFNATWQVVSKKQGCPLCVEYKKYANIDIIPDVVSNAPIFNYPSSIEWLRPYIKPFDTIQYVEGVYFLCIGDVVIYVGSSHNIVSRIGWHLENKWFDKIYYICTNGLSIDTRTALEYDLIANLNPILNKDKKMRYFLIPSSLFITHLDSVKRSGTQINLRSPSLPILISILYEKCKLHIENVLGKNKA